MPMRWIRNWLFAAGCLLAASGALAQTNVIMNYRGASGTAVEASSSNPIPSRDTGLVLSANSSSTALGAIVVPEKSDIKVRAESCSASSGNIIAEFAYFLVKN